mmetsp:Transcript_75986/g.215027  ORF Transcript_75986/g.215027 Transcript_75986/m.215027 type:complete len:173 (-) Transcript_75986:79-597(-)
MGGPPHGDPFPGPPFERPPHLHVTTLFLGGAAPTERQRMLLSSSRQLLRAAGTFDCSVTHLVCARGALACAVVDAEQLRAGGAPLEAERPHVTLCTRPPWKPRHSNDILAVVGPLLNESPASAPKRMYVEAGGAGAAAWWWPQMRVGDAVVDIFIYQLVCPLELRQNLLQLQ